MDTNETPPARLKLSRTYEEWLVAQGVLHRKVEDEAGPYCQADGTEWPCHMHRLLEAAK